MIPLAEIVGSLGGRFHWGIRLAVGLICLVKVVVYNSEYLASTLSWDALAYWRVSILNFSGESLRFWSDAQSSSNLSHITSDLKLSELKHIGKQVVFTSRASCKSHVLFRLRV